MDARLLAALCILLTGCLAGGPAAKPDSAATSAALPTVDADTGSIAGVVLNEEQVAVPHAQVALLGPGNATPADKTGAFTFNGLLPGEYTVVALALGYDQATVAATVVAGEVTEVIVPLVAIAVPKPRIEVLHHKSLIEYAGTNYAKLCDDDCAWLPEYDDPPLFVYVEAYGDHSTANAARKDGLNLWAYKGEFGQPVHSCLWTDDPTCLDLPVRFWINQTDIEKTAPEGKPLEELWLAWSCDPFWFCVDEPYEIYVSLFYDYDPALVPAGYTAKPEA